MKTHIYTPKVIIVVLMIVSMRVVSAPLSFILPVGEGGSNTAGAIDSFEQYMSENNCTVNVSFSNEGPKGELYFSASPRTGLANNVDRYTSLSSARTYKDYPLTTAIIIKSSRGIRELKSVEGERLSMISNSSYLGGEKTRALYSSAEVPLEEHDVYLTEYYEGAITLLLHGDVFVAALPGPLAKRWAKANDLAIIAESEVLDIGEVIIASNIDENQKQHCKSALENLERTTRRDKRMNIFPGWVEGFK